MPVMIDVLRSAFTEDCNQTYRRDIKDSRYKNLASVSGMSMALIHMQAAHCVLFVCFQGCS
jgi:hypothetical protein